MKHNIPKMFRFGNIANSIYLGVGVFVFSLSIVLLIIGAATNKPEITSAAWDLFKWGFYLALGAFLCLIIVIGKAEKQAADESNKSLSPYILSIVFGVISSNPFYVIAGIFGVIVTSKENNNENKEEPKQIEEPKE